MEQIKISHHGRQIDGSVYRPENSERCPVVIMSHGYNGHQSDFTEMAQYLTANGIGAVCFTFCGGSLRDNSGFPTTEMTLFTEAEDLRAVLDEVTSWDWADAKQIYLFGASQGGMVSALVAEERTEQIRGMILLYPAFCIADDWRKRFKRREDIPDREVLWDMPLGRCYFESVWDFVIMEHIGGFDKPVLLLHGTQDEIVPLSYSEQAAAQYPKAKLKRFVGEGHGFTAAGDQRVRELTLMFLQEHMGKR